MPKLFTFSMILPVFLIAVLIAGCIPKTANPDKISPAQIPTTIKSNLTYRIVDTGQLTCYDNIREMTCPKPGEAFYGQDAQYQGNLPSYRDNGDGTISDLMTSMMWQKTPGAKVTYADALTGTKSFKLAGYADWRLPTIKELYSLILFSGRDVSPMMNSRTTGNNSMTPFLDTRYFDFKYGDASTGERIIDAQYLSCTEYVSKTMQNQRTVFGVNFADGRIKGYPADSGPRNQPVKQFVRYVRGTLDYGINNFIDNGNNTITDRATGLMWAKNDSTRSMNWQESLAWVQQKNSENYLGCNDWRLPDAKELQSIIDYSRSPSTTSSAAISPLFNITSIADEGGKTNYPFFWTATSHVDSSNRATFAVYICFGEALGYMQNPGSASYTLLDVHGAGAQRSDPKTGNPAEYPYGHGPQGDIVRINNFVRCVRTVTQ